jgi:hypothetical protein
MWYSFMLNGQKEIIMPLQKDLKRYSVEEIILGKHPEATDIKVATDEEVTAVIERVKREETEQIPLAQREAEIRLVDSLLQEAWIPPKDFKPVTKINKPQSFA